MPPQRRILYAAAAALAALLPACPPGVVDLIANTSPSMIRVSIVWGHEEARSPQKKSTDCPHPFFWLVAVDRVEQRKLPGSLKDLRAASVSYDDAQCAATVDIPPGMACGAGKPKGYPHPRIAFAEQIAIEQGDRKRIVSRDSFGFKYEFDYGAPRLNVWRVNLGVAAAQPASADAAIRPRR